MLANAQANDLNRLLELNALCLHGEYEGNNSAITGLSRKGDYIICQFSSIDEAVLPEASLGNLLVWLMTEKRVPGECSPVRFQHRRSGI